MIISRIPDRVPAFGLRKIGIIAAVSARMGTDSPHGWDNAIKQVVPTALARLWRAILTRNGRRPARPPGSESQGVRSTPTPKNCRGRISLVNATGPPVPGIAGDRASRFSAWRFVVPYSR